SQQSKFLLPGHLADPELDLDTLNMDAKWTFQKNDQLLLDLRRLNFSRQEMQGSFSGTHLLPLDRQASNSLGIIDMHGTITGLPLADVGDYLPLEMNDGARTWLAGALVGGTLRDGEITIKGD